MKPGLINQEVTIRECAGCFASVNDLSMYYEIHGTGTPLVLLHGGLMTIEALVPLLPALAQSHSVIVPELEGHGRTADLDRPLSYEQMAEDVAVLLEQLEIKQADFIGYSLGGTVALQIAMRHPDLVHKLVVVSAPYSQEGYYPSVIAGWPDLSAEAFAGTAVEQAYFQTAPDPEHWPVFLEKVKHALMSFKGWPASDIQVIKAPTLIILGDDDVMRPEHAVEMFHLLGGARVEGSMTKVPRSQLAVLPGTTHFNILYRLELLLPVITPFLEEQMPTED